MSKSLENGKELRRRWQISKIIRRFSLRCLDDSIIPVSLKLRSNLKTPKAMKIIRKTERALLNERIRMINNTIEMLEHEKDTCMEVLSKVLNQEGMDECNRFMFTDQRR